MEQWLKDSIWHIVTDISLILVSFLIDTLIFINPTENKNMKYILFSLILIILVLSIIKLIQDLSSRKQLHKTLKDLKEDIHFTDMGSRFHWW